VAFLDELQKKNWYNIYHLISIMLIVTLLRNFNCRAVHLYVALQT